MSGLRNSVAPVKPVSSSTSRPVWNLPNAIVPPLPSDTGRRSSCLQPPPMEGFDSPAEYIDSPPPMTFAPKILTPPPRLELTHRASTFNWAGTTPALRLSKATDSVYSQPETAPSFYSRHDTQTIFDLPSVPVGQAYTAAGRVSPPIEVASFPLPPTSYPTKPPRLPSQPGSRNLLPIPEGDQAHASSVFEYSDFARSRHGSMATNRSGEADPTRQTRNWYEKPLWDGQSLDPGESIYGEVEREFGTQTSRERSMCVKNVRWGDEGLETAPKLF